MIKIALEYLKKGYSVLPMRRDTKSPVVAWTEYQKRLPTEKELIQWFQKYPQSNVGFATGMVSGIAVIDIDSPEGKEQVSKIIPDSLIFPIATSPRGGEHWYFKCTDSKLQTKARIDGFTGIDIRANGGCIVAPPSVNDLGKGYKWMEHLSILEVEPPEMPQDLYAKLPKIGEHLMTKPPIRTGMFTAGTRDEDLFHTAWFLVKAKMPVEEIYQVLLTLCHACIPPMPENVVKEKVVSALRRANEQPRDLKNEVAAWCVQNDRFRIESLFNELDLKTKEHKAECRKVLNDLMAKGIIERGSSIGELRLTNKQIEHIEIPDVMPKPMPISWPFFIETYVNIYPGSICIIAGTSNAGKTAFCLNVAKKNMEKYPIRYMSSEMDGVELRGRLGGFGINLNVFREKVEWINRGREWWDIINPDAINIIDFMEIYDNFFEIGKWIKLIHERLNKGIALIAIQKKDKNTDDGRGGAITREKARLYISMNYGEMKIVKAKNWATSEDPNGMSIEFEMENAVILTNTTPWKMAGRN